MLLFWWNWLHKRAHSVLYSEGNVKQTVFKTNHLSGVNSLKDLSHNKSARLLYLYTSTEILQLKKAEKNYGEIPGDCWWRSAGSCFEKRPLQIWNFSQRLSAHVCEIGRRDKMIWRVCVELSIVDMTLVSQAVVLMVKLQGINVGSLKSQPELRLFAGGGGRGWWEKPKQSIQIRELRWCRLRAGILGKVPLTCNNLGRLREFDKNRKKNWLKLSRIENFSNVPRVRELGSSVEERTANTNLLVLELEIFPNFGFTI